jgi:hypothetical protein
VQSGALSRLQQAPEDKLFFSSLQQAPDDNQQPSHGRKRSHNFCKFKGPVLNCRDPTVHTQMHCSEFHHGVYLNESVIDEIRKYASAIFQNFLSAVVKQKSSSCGKIQNSLETFSVRGWYGRQSGALSRLQHAPDDNQLQSL